MQAFITSVEDIFSNKISDFKWKKDKKLKIPLYQREYEWDTSSVENLVLDILNRDKFLGMIILDEKEDCYEISDGQQRLTTIILSLLSLYNNYKGSLKEQSVIEKCIYDGDSHERILNESIGHYISKDKDNDCLKVVIDEEQDVYNQKKTFENAYDTINGILSKNDRYKEFKGKLKKCTLLVLIKNIESSNSDAVEQIFLDINEKSKRLDNASIFKGYCFKIYEESHEKSYLDELKELWIRLKKAYIAFKEFSEKNYKFDEYIYTYLLVTEAEDMPENLSPDGRHFLEDKNMDEVETILTQMVEYGERVYSFYEKIQNDTYMFEDICVDSNSYKTASKHLITNVKDYMLYSIKIKSAQYQKVPLNWLIYFVKDKSYTKKWEMKGFMTITANLYIYSFLFTLSSSKKSKKNIDHSLYNAMKENVEPRQIIDLAKDLRKKQVENVQLPESCSSFDSLSNLYTIMDCFIVKENIFKSTYHNHGEQKYTLEHFIIPDKRNCKIKWISSDEEKNRELVFTGQSGRKNRLINFLIVEKDLNNKILLDYDVIKKIELISKYYKENLPKHVNIIISHIKSMSKYKELKELKSEEDIDVIKDTYNNFLDEYFSEDNQRVLLSKILEGLKTTFVNS